MKQTTQEERFSKWMRDRDDDFADVFSIWDFRIVKEFFDSELALRDQELAERIKMYAGDSEEITLKGAQELLKLLALTDVSEVVKKGIDS